MLMQNPADAKSYRSWLPPSSGPASRARLLANKASSSSSKSPKLKPMPKQRAKKCDGKKKRTNTVQVLTKSALSVGSVRNVECFSKVPTAQLWEAARFSRKQNIPSFPLLQLGDQLQQSLPLPMAFQYIDQTAWSLSLCSAKLPTLSRHDRFNAVKQRIEECHEGETMRNAFEPLELSENPCQKVKPQVAEHQCQAPQNAPRESRTYRKE